MGRRLVFGFEAGISVALFDRSAPNDSEWDAYSDSLNEKIMAGTLSGSLVVTEGGAPTTAQRARAVAKLKGHDIPPTALVSDSRIVRGVVTALTWMRNDAKMRVFSPKEIEEAVRFLGVRGMEHKRVMFKLLELEKGFGRRHGLLA